MKKSMKWILIAAAICIVVGGALVLLGIGREGLDLSAPAAETSGETYQVERSFTDLNVAVGSYDVQVLPGTGDVAVIRISEGDMDRFVVDVSGDTLIVRQEAENGLFLALIPRAELSEDASVTIELPGNSYQVADITTASGNITLAEGLNFESASLQTASGEAEALAKVTGFLGIFSASGNVNVTAIQASAINLETASGAVALTDCAAEGEIEINTASGNVNLTRVQAGELGIDTASGTVRLQDVIVQRNLEIDAVSGDVRLEASDAAYLEIETTSGDVSGTLLAPKIFEIETASGRVNVPQNPQGGGYATCEISTTSGSIEIYIK